MRDCVASVRQQPRNNGAHRHDERSPMQQGTTPERGGPTRTHAKGRRHAKEKAQRRAPASESRTERASRRRRKVIDTQRRTKRVALGTQQEAMKQRGTLRRGEETAQRDLAKHSVRECGAPQKDRHQQAHRALDALTTGAHDNSINVHASCPQSVVSAERSVHTQTHIDTERKGKSTAAPMQAMHGTGSTVARHAWTQRQGTQRKTPHARQAQTQNVTEEAKKQAKKDGRNTTTGEKKHPTQRQNEKDADTSTQKKTTHTGDVPETRDARAINSNQRKTNAAERQHKETKKKGKKSKGRQKERSKKSTKVKSAHARNRPNARRIGTQITRSQRTTHTPKARATQEPQQRRKKNALGWNKKQDKGRRAHTRKQTGQTRSQAEA
ncbi:hypothetical protein, conserved in T. vivax [Trypanosoma vivax Y486]|uniref:Uncharacterized protein n=1 Tax=Trypanosoma vivax (strain Y486) TaxID=1055687 RepID=F9WPT6_TRYVY|nr:hypothetical protein, conserved in T. vivax [Trypanosoma vivax Y486]|eukprot:CCD19563.1 hypothetical protein, conserved in T. vivax [Trypanosoma vivax Y486]